MKLCFRFLAVAVIVTSAFALNGCGSSSSYTYKSVSVSLAFQCADTNNCPYGIITNPAQPAAVLILNGNCFLVTATVVNASANITWSIYPTPNLVSTQLPTGTSLPVGESGSTVGTLIQATGATNYYCAPSGPPVYNGDALLQANSMTYTINGQTMTGIPQGDVLLAASVPSDPSNPSAVVTAYQLMQMYGTSASVTFVNGTPTNPTQTTSVATVPRGTTYQFTAFATGQAPCQNTTACLLPATVPAGFTQTQFPLYSTDNSIIWEVGTSTTNGVVGGSAAEGFISSTGVYTAPATIPATQPVIIAVSHAVPTASAYAYITID
jgi:hypothetical protein